MKEFYNPLTKPLRRVLLLTACIALTAAQANNLILDRKITLSMINVPMHKVLTEIEREAQISFMYSPDVVDAKALVSVSATEEKLSVILDELLTNRGIQYKVHEKTNSITLKQVEKRAKPSSTLETEDATDVEKRVQVSGTVTDRNNAPLPGVNVLIKGTASGTSTDASGRYAIQVEPNATLVFTFIGFETQEISITDQAVLNIILQDDIKTLDEVVVNAGYWKVTEREQTGNIAQISREEINRQPSNNVLQALQGQVTGVFIQQLSGVPGGSFNIQVRGQNSLRNSATNNGNRPLYIIDGVPFNSSPLGTSESSAIIDGGNPLNNLNPADIETIEILKDADATAIYGSRGANGVVLITTRKGKAGKTQFNVNWYHGVGTVSRKMDLLNTQQYLAMRNEALTNDGLVAGTYFSDNDLRRWDQTRYTDWQEKLLGGSAGIMNMQISASGGSQTTQFLASVGYFKESTVFPGSFSDRKVSANIKLNHTSLDNRFSLGFSGYYLVDNNQLPRIDLTSRALTLAPNAPALRNADGTLNWENSTWTNPLSYLKQDLDARTTNLVSNTNLSYNIAKGLDARINFGYSELRFDEYTSQPRSSFNPAFNTPSSATFADKKVTSWISEPQLEYKRTIAGATFTALVGTTWQQTDQSFNGLTASGFASENLLRNKQAATSLVVTSAQQLRYRYGAAFGRININWRGKYLLNLTGRRDGSSRFGAERRFANFGAIGAAWIISEESWLMGTPISFAKVRASYGTTGSDQIGDYGFLDLWTTTPYAYDGKTGLYPTNLANPTYSWEANNKWEAALDMGAWKDKINLSISFYRNVSSSQLVGIPLPATTGFNSVQANMNAEVLNRGWEIKLTGNWLKKNSFLWSTTANITVPHNELVKFPGLATSSFSADYIVGEPLSVLPAYVYLGVNPETGLYQHKDINNDGLYNAADRQGQKNLQQQFFGGIQNSFSWKGLSLDVLVQMVKQDGRNYLTYFTSRPGLMGNQPQWVLDRWQEQGDKVSVQQFTQGFGAAWQANQRDAQSDHRISDASFVRLRAVSLNYTLPQAWTTKIGLQMVKIIAQGQNLWLHTNYKGLDPETQRASLPPLKRVNVGVNLNF